VLHARQVAPELPHWLVLVAVMHSFVAVQQPVAQLVESQVFG
jgi:hypothetical protein